MSESLTKENMEGKTIKEAWVSEDNIEIIFTDGSSIDIRLELYGYGGARLNNSYYPTDV